MLIISIFINIINISMFIGRWAIFGRKNRLRESNRVANFERN